MAITQNTYTGNGSTVLFSFTFPYLETTDIKVSLNGVITTAYTLANATTIQFTTAPVNGAAIRIFRVTDDASLAATFYPGSAIRSQDLNENFTQNLYVTQEINSYAIQDIGSVTLAANYTFNGTVSGQTPTINSHLVTKAYVDALAFSATGIVDGDKGDIIVAGSGTSWTIQDGNVTPSKLSQSYLTTGTASSTYLTQANASSTYLTQANASSTYGYTTTITAVSKTLANRERCTVTASGLTITLPATPTAGAEVAVTVVGVITNTIIARNGQNIMSLAEDFTIDRADVTVTLYYVDATRGWRII